MAIAALPPLESASMAKQHYFFKLIPPRSTFPGDITAEERALMAQHAAHCAEHFSAGRILAYGPVMAPGAAFGFGVFEVESESEARSIGDNDPTVLAGMNTYEIYPMHLANIQAKRQ